MPQSILFTEGEDYKTWGFLRLSLRKLKLRSIGHLLVVSGICGVWIWAYDLNYISRAVPVLPSSLRSTLCRYTTRSQRRLIVGNSGLSLGCLLVTYPLQSPSSSSCAWEVTELVMPWHCRLPGDHCWDLTPLTPVSLQVMPMHASDPPFPLPSALIRVCS